MVILALSDNFLTAHVVTVTDTIKPLYSCAQSRNRYAGKHSVAVLTTNFQIYVTCQQFSEGLPVNLWYCWNNDQAVMLRNQLRLSVCLTAH